MNKTLQISFSLRNTYRVNSILYSLKQIPLVKKILPDRLYSLRGFKIFANIIALITLYLYDARAMLAVSLMRVLFVSLLQGTLFATSFWLSLSGVLLSCAAMSIARRCRCFSIYGVSVLGSVFHCIGQVIAVSWIYRQFFMQALLPLLCALGVLSGLLIGALAHQVLNRLQRERE